MHVWWSIMFIRGLNAVRLQTWLHFSMKVLALLSHIWGAKLQDWLENKPRTALCSLQGKVGARAGELTYHSPVISSIAANLCANKPQSSKSKCHWSMCHNETAKAFAICISESEITLHFSQDQSVKLCFLETWLILAEI